MLWDGGEGEGAGEVWLHEWLVVLADIVGEIGKRTGGSIEGFWYWGFYVRVDAFEGLLSDTGAIWERGGQRERVGGTKQVSCSVSTENVRRCFTEERCMLQRIFVHGFIRYAKREC